MSEEARTLTVPASLDGARLDKALVVLAGLSRSKAKAALDAGVRVNGRRAPKGSTVKEGDVLTLGDVATSGTDATAIADPDVALDVRLETPEVIVLHKPPKLATAPLQPGERGTLANGIAAKYPECVGVGADPREPGLLHRLDTDTSGLVLVARSRAAFEELRNALREGRVEKRYLAIVAPGAGSSRASSVAATGELADRGTIAYPLAQHPKDKRRVFACVHERDVARLAPREATTSYQVKKRWEEDGKPRALVEATAPKALRHQIRVHFAALGAPLVGDGLYGGPPAQKLGRHALHASRVSFGGSSVVPAFVVEDPLPDDIASLIPE